VPCTVKLPTTVVSPVNVEIPVTANAPLTDKSFVIVTSFGNPIVNVSTPVATSISFAVPETVNVSPPEIVVGVEPSVKVKPVEATESTYAILAASVPATGVDTLEIIELLASI